VDDDDGYVSGQETFDVEVYFLPVVEPVDDYEE
jgi:hypothetical protein